MIPIRSLRRATDVRAEPCAALSRSGGQLASVLLAAFLLAACAATHEGVDSPPQAASAGDVAAGAAVEVVLASDVVWEQLNPARGDQSPQAGTLWGDRKGPGATGFLLKPVDGFRSPPHIHNVSYRGVVISGLIHNDHPEAEDVWMPAGSFWTQPRGGVHITAALGEETYAIIEIDEGPYLVLGVDEQFEDQDDPINMPASEIRWEPATVQVEGYAQPAASMAPLFGSRSAGSRSGLLLKLPPGYRGTLDTGDGTFRAVVVEGELALGAAEGGSPRTLATGSYLGSHGAAKHDIACLSEADCVLYLSVDCDYRIVDGAMR